MVLGQGRSRQLRYIWGGLPSQNRSGTSSFYLCDSQGSVRNLTSVAGAITDTLVYTAFGVELLTSGSTMNPFRYVGLYGYYRDMPELMQIRARWLSAMNGRWLSRDPIGWDGGDVNFTLYVLNNPLTMIDPSGTIQYSGATLKVSIGSRTGTCNREGSVNMLGSTALFLMWLCWGIFAPQTQTNAQSVSHIGAQRAFDEPIPMGEFEASPRVQLNVSFELLRARKLFILPYGNKPGHGACYLITGGDNRHASFRIRTLKELANRVRICDRNQALCFVRLFTADDTYSVGRTAGGIRAIEVFTKAERPTRKFGVISPEDIKPINWKEAEVSCRANCWTIVRTLISPDSQVIMRVKELVYPNGRYKAEVISKIERPVGIHIPMPQTW